MIHLSVGSSPPEECGFPNLSDSCYHSSQYPNTPLSDATAEFLDLLTLLCLRDFYLILTTEGPWLQASFESLMRRSSAKVTTLGIESKAITATEIT
ncbi:hypothetical protein C8J56DRAFT_1063648 [Mycena floridula]|nr:hypothetical protein C8J56DRAFT_1063648 [Mycena floridula]